MVGGGLESFSCVAQLRTRLCCVELWLMHMKVKDIPVHQRD